MHYSKVKDNKNRSQFYKQEKKKLVYKYLYIQLISNSKLVNNCSKKILFLFRKSYQKKLGSFSKTTLIRRCTSSNRNRSVLRPYNLSRIVLRNFISAGFIPGYKKAVW